jgi:hypothetical protein
MPGGIMELVAYGAEDLYLTGNPQITHFKVVYRRHTNFAMEYIEQYFYSMPDYSTTQKTQAKIKIGRHADLLHDLYLIYDLPNIRFPIEDYTDLTPEDVNFKWIRDLGHNIIYTTEVSIDGQRLDIQYGQWMQIWSELTVTDSKKEAYDRLVGNYYKLRPGFSQFYPDKSGNVTIPSTRLYIPLEFWFCKNPGLALPLIALQYSEVYIYFEFNPLNFLFTVGKDNLSPTAFFSQGNLNQNSDPDSFPMQLLANGINDKTLLNEFIEGEWNQHSCLLANFIYLDDDERRRFAQSSHEYLIHQTQRRLFTGVQQGITTKELDLFHPVKELIWVFQKDSVRDLNDWGNYTFLDLYNDYNQMKKEYNSKFDFLPHQADMAFMQQNNNFIKQSELNPIDQNCNFLGPGLSKTLAFNDYTNIMLSAKLIFNGHDRFEERDHVFFNALQSYKYHTHSAPDGVYIYSFALHPEEEQPSGTSNFSRINKIELQFNIRKDICEDDLPNLDPVDEVAGIAGINPVNYNLYVYALNYNVLRIAGGMAGIAFEL